MPKTIHRDFFGVEINEGDYVVAADRSYFNCYKVIKICNKQIRVKNVDTDVSWSKGVLRYSSDLVIMDPAAVTFRKLKNA